MKTGISGVFFFFSRDRDREREPSERTTTGKVEPGLCLLVAQTSNNPANYCTRACNANDVLEKAEVSQEDIQSCLSRQEYISPVHLFLFIQVSGHYDFLFCFIVFRE